ncbi:hypothetical protein F53441_11730 [Fusarium austroafricanum]|uniref:Uncharacterized protein n=1 Tax=Fusarium austroafricanum TaxID=2364996 RepID=A0A8H4K3B1_9HYPO|nr:hypothetical protein F53441_11730 [Fusarium austroafricanum]
MSYSQDLPRTNSTKSSPDSTLVIDYKWKKGKALVSEKDHLTNTTTPKYTVDYHAFKCASLEFRPFHDKSALIGRGQVHPVSIHADYEINGQKGTIKALRHFITSYTHLSYNFSDSADGTPAAMEWTSDSSFKTWDFICLDEQRTPVAKFSANTFSLNKVGTVEFLGPKSHSVAAREEILIVGMTLFYQMMLRATNFLHLGGAIFSRPGPLDKEAAPKNPYVGDDGRSIKELDDTSVPAYAKSIKELEDTSVPALNSEK